MKTLNQALSERRQKPGLSLRAAGGSDVPKSTLHDRETGKHAPRGVRGNRALSVVQEGQILEKINRFAVRGTLLTPRHIQEVAEELAGRRLGKNWASGFIRRHEKGLEAKYYAIQQAARISADTPETRKAFFDLASSTLDKKGYLPRNIYNMDEVGFKLSSSHRVRAVAPRGTSTKAQAILDDDVHITTVLTIGIEDAPVPPLLLYPGNTLQQEWFNVHDSEPDLVAWVTKTGYSNQFMTTWWLENVFDPYTKPRARNDRRLLVLDGSGVHHSVQFYNACWDRNIDLLFLPHNLTATLQPLDVNFNRTLKGHYDHEVRDFQHALEGSRASKGHFYRWFQSAWRQTASPRQIRDAWHDAGLRPLNRTIMRAVTPPRPEDIAPEVLATPQSTQKARQLERAVRRGEVEPVDAFFKAIKAFELAETKRVVLGSELEKRQAAEAVDKAARGRNKRTKFPQGVVFDQKWRDEHVQELEDWGQAERARDDAKAAAAARAREEARTKRKGKQRESQAGPSRER